MEIFEIQTILLSLVEISLKEGNEQKASHIAKLSQEAARLFEQWDYKFKYILCFSSRPEKSRFHKYILSSNP